MKLKTIVSCSCTLLHAHGTVSVCRVIRHISYHFAGGLDWEPGGVFGCHPLIPCPLSEGNAFSDTTKMPLITSLLRSLSATSMHWSAAQLMMVNIAWLVTIGYTLLFTMNRGIL